MELSISRYCVLVVKWLSRLPVTEEIAGSNPVEHAKILFSKKLQKFLLHLPPMHDFHAQLHKQTYDALADEYESRVETFRAVTERALQPFINALPQNAKILDVGCAVGYTVEILQQYQHVVEGIDISPEMIAHARHRNPQSTFVVADFLEHPYKVESFDGALLYAFLHLFPKQTAIQVMSKVTTVLKPGGFIFIGTTKSAEASEGFEEKADYSSNEKRYRKRWTQMELETLFEELGLKVIHYEDNTDEFGKVWMDYVVQKAK